MNINLTREELDKLIKSNDLERYTQQQFKQFVESNEEVLIKGERGELDDIEKSEYDTLIAELQSFTTVNVFDTAPESKNRIVKSIEFIRPKQVEWDEIEKSEDGEEDLSKARSGVYTDTSLNRKLGRVGQKYGSKKQSADEGDDKGKSDKLGDVPWESTSFGSSVGGGYQLTFNTEAGKKTIKVEGKDVEKLMSGSKEEKQAIKKEYYNRAEMIRTAESKTAKNQMNEQESRQNKEEKKKGKMQGISYDVLDSAPNESVAGKKKDTGKSFREMPY